MTRGKPWTHDELMVAMNLYCKLPFGQLRHGNPLVIEIAERLGRSPSSLSMKLCNLASLDPYHQARGIKGLSSVSRADKEIWEEFNADWGRLGVESEEKLQDLLGESGEIEQDVVVGESRAEKMPVAMPLTAPTGSTEEVALVKARLGQSFFRKSVLASYNSRCCITGNPIPELLVASHILPWRKFPEHRLNPRNGLCLAQTQDAAFDKGLVTFDEDYRLVISPYLKEFLPNEALARNFLDYEGKRIAMPDKFLPDEGFLREHREGVFRG
ncbi:MAG: HNH endonuclease [Syntrophaceae bacterium]|nr:HNH endonuclease [Syntrophaceae bacterium]